MTVSEELNRQGARVAHAVRVFGQDAAILALTDFDEDLTFGGFIHRSVAGTRFAALERTADLAPDHLSIETAVAEQGLSEAAIATGVYAEARAEIWRVDTEEPSINALISVGTIGEIARNGDQLSLEFRSATHALSNVGGRIYQKSCGAKLGDQNCGVDLETSAFLVNGTVTEQSGLSILIEADASVNADHFSLGRILITSGALSGLSRAIRQCTLDSEGLRVLLWEALPGTLAPGETVALYAGCDKSFETCRDRFSNTRRFFGFPHVPGTDVLAVQSRRS